MNFLRFFRLSPNSSKVFQFSLPENTDPYSTDEVSTISTWVDGRTIYRKVLTFAQGPNAVQLSIPHGITEFDKFIKCYGAMNGSSKTIIPLPYVGDQLDFSPNTCVNVQADDTNVYVTPINGMGQDWSAYSGFVILEYVK